MMKRFSLTPVILFLAIQLTAQGSLDSLLFKVQSGNPSLASARHLLEAKKLEASSGLAPANPEVEFAYLWGSPDILGDRTDFSISQSFDFPTVYTSRNKLAEINRSQADLEYYAIRQEVMFRTRQVWITRVHLNRVHSILQMRLVTAETVLEGFRRKQELGEANQLQLNQARMKVTSLKNEISLLKQKLSQNDAELLNLTGNTPVAISDTAYPLAKMFELDSLLAAYQEGYVNKVYLAEIEKKSKEVDVVFNHKLPKFKAGYYSEHILGTKLRGIQAGITIPLWENARAVKSAKAQLVFAQSDAQSYWLKKQNEIRNMYQQWSYLKDRVSELELLLADSNDEILLRTAMESGEISLTDYYYESDFYYQNIFNLLEFKKEMLLLEAELGKVYY